MGIAIVRTAAMTMVNPQRRAGSQKRLWISEDSELGLLSFIGDTASRLELGPVRMIRRFTSLIDAREDRHNQPNPSTH
jgi:hypothetical protein